MLTTSEMPFISSDHGRQRRNERDITKRDLQAAVKYGIKTPGYQHRKHGSTWKYEFADVVYITDSTSTVEITSYALELPLYKVNITPLMEEKIMEAKRRITSNPSIVTSNTVIIVDMSASMGNADINGHRTRSAGVYYTIAENFIANRLYPPEVAKLGGDDLSFTDIVTLIEMRADATVVFKYEPISWKIFNLLVDLRDLKDTRNHGNYFNSFQEAFGIIQDLKCSNKCAHCLFFFLMEDQVILLLLGLGNE